MKFFICVLLMLVSFSAYCQTGGVGINAGGNPPDPSALLDLSSTNKGLLIPRMSETQRDAINNPALGLQIYDTTDNCVEIYGFGTWQTLSCLCTGVPSVPGAIIGNNYPCNNASNVTYSVGLVLGATSYAWTVPSDAAIIAGQGTNSITVNFGVKPGNVAVTADNSCGTSSPDTLAISMDSIPYIPGSISGSDSVCSNSTGNVYSISPIAGASTYTWSVPGDAIITAGQGMTSATVTFGNTSGIVAVTAANVCGNSQASNIIVTNTLVTHGTESFYFSGTQQIFVVPGCAYSVTIAAYGAQGSGQYNNGASGGSATGTLAVTPGDTLFVYVGGQNGYNGGGTGGGNGGGMSDVRLGGTGFNNWVIVAGGGGGGGNDGGGYVNTTTGTGGGGAACANGAGGGAGGYATSGGGGVGGAGTCSVGGSSGYSDGGWAGGGGGGGLTSGGSGGVSGGYGPAGADGSQGQGGNATDGCGCNLSYVGGGGGGYYGGGGASAGCCAGGSGGGGSSWALPSMTNVSFSGGVQSGNGQIVITW